MFWNKLESAFYKLAALQQAPSMPFFSPEWAHQARRRASKFSKNLQMSICTSLLTATKTPGILLRRRCDMDEVVSQTRKVSYGGLLMGPFRKLAKHVSIRRPHRSGTTSAINWDLIREMFSRTGLEIFSNVRRSP